MAILTMMSPVGSLVLEEEEGCLVRLGWGAVQDASANPFLLDAAKQISEFFSGERRAFELPLAPQGTPFQKQVWTAMSEIPFGETLTYGELAAIVGSVPRAIGRACGANPIPIVIPCHRILAANGPGGYSGTGGLATKAALLRVENRDTLLL